eukprot:sb/3465769/
MVALRLLALLTVLLIGVTDGTKITVYQSPLTYYDVEHREGGWLETAAVEKEIPFSSRFECQFVTLPFEFPYYADKITRLGVTRLGFVYTGPYTNARLTELMHIAPLMNLFTFNSGNVTQATVLDEGKSIYVLQWNNVSILNYTATFQLQLHLNGTMVFAYQNISSEVLNMAVVSVVSAFPWVNSATADVAANPLVQQPSQFGTNCSICTDIAVTTPFSCQWCTTLRRCSDTFDARYEEWAEHCSSTKTESTECAAYSEDATTEPTASAIDTAVDSYTTLGEWLEALLSEGVLAYDSGSLISLDLSECRCSTAHLGSWPALKLKFNSVDFGFYCEFRDNKFISFQDRVLVQDSSGIPLLDLVTTVFTVPPLTAR